MATSASSPGTEIIENNVTGVNFTKTDNGKTSREKGANAAKKRLQKELMALMVSGEKGVSAFPDGDNLFKWVATIDGPKETVYDNLKFKLNLEFTSKYPYVAPTVTFSSTCFHPNVDSSGNICLDILKEKWTALYDVRTILLSIQSLLSEPNLESPLDSLAASLWNQKEFKQVMLSRMKKRCP